MRMNEKRPDLSGVPRWIEQRIFARHPNIAAVQCFALTPAATPDNFRLSRFGQKISAVGNELAIDTENPL